MTTITASGRMDRYNIEEAHDIAERIWRKYERYLALAASIYDVPAHWLAGLTGLENPDCYEWPASRATTYRKDVYEALTAVQGAVPQPPSFDGVTREALAGHTPDTRKALATYYGQTQIPGYKLLTTCVGFAGMTVGQLLSGPNKTLPTMAVMELIPPGYDAETVLGESLSLRHLRDPRLHYFFTAHLLTRDPRLSKWVRAHNTTPLPPEMWGPQEWAERERWCLYQMAQVWHVGKELTGDELAGVMDAKPGFGYLHSAWLVAQMYLGMGQEHEESSDGPRGRSLWSYPPSRFFLSTDRPVAPPDPDACIPFTQEEVTRDDSDATTRFAKDFALDLYGRGLLTSEQSDDVAASLEKALREGGLPPNPHRPALTPTEEALKAGAFDSALKGKYIDPETLTRQILRERGWDDMSDMSGKILVDETSDTSEPEDPQMASTTLTPRIIPTIGVKPGLKTTEGQFTALFILIAAILSMVGYSTTPEHVQGTADSINAIAKTLVPMLAAAPILFNYITSRGKTKSNAINATALAVKSQSEAQIATYGPQSLLGLNKIGKVLRDERLTAGLEIASALGVPGAGMADNILGRVTGAMGPQLSNEAVVAGFERVNSRLASLELSVAALSRTPPPPRSAETPGHSSR